MEQVCQRHFPNSVCSLPVFLSCFGNFHRISNPPAAKKNLQLAEGTEDDWHFLAMRFFFQFKVGPFFVVVVVVVLDIMILHP